MPPHTLGSVLCRETSRKSTNRIFPVITGGEADCDVGQDRHIRDWHGDIVDHELAVIDHAVDDLWTDFDLFSRQNISLNCIMKVIHIRFLRYFQGVRHEWRNMAALHIVPLGTLSVAGRGGTRPDVEGVMSPFQTCSRSYLEYRINRLIVGIEEKGRTDQRIHKPL